MAKLPSAGAVQLGVLVGFGNLLIFNHFVGASAADIKTAEPFDIDIEKSERTALLAGIAFTVVAAGFVKSWDTFAIGGMALVIADFALKHANSVDPNTHAPMDMGSPMGGSTSYPTTGYSEDNTAA